MKRKNKPTGKYYKKINTRWHRNAGWIYNNVGHIELRNRKNERIGIAMVDREDFFKCINEIKWSLQKTGNVVGRSLDGQVVTLRRFVLCSNEHIYYEDFVSCDDGNLLNCQKENLSIGKNVNQYST